MGRSGRLAVLVLLVGTLAHTAARGQGDSPPPASAQEVDVVAVVQDARTLQPVVVLSGKRDKRPLILAMENKILVPTRFSPIR